MAVNPAPDQHKLSEQPLSVYTPADLQAIETRINTMPRRSIDWSTAQDLYNEAVAMTG